MENVKTENLKKQKPKVHQELEGFDIQINPFGEVISTINIDKINQFLDDYVDDKKLNAREDDEGKSGKK